MLSTILGVRIIINIPQNLDYQSHSLPNLLKLIGQDKHWKLSSLIPASTYVNHDSIQSLTLMAAGAVDVPDHVPLTSMSLAAA